MTLEERLNGFDDEKWPAALEGGVNRFSFGVQSFDNRVGLAAGRLDAREAAGWEHFSCCHWRRDGREHSRYNRLAKSGAEILPFGAGAGGVFQGMRVMNGRDSERVAHGALGRTRRACHDDGARAE